MKLDRSRVLPRRPLACRPLALGMAAALLCSPVGGLLAPVYAQAPAPPVAQAAPPAVAPAPPVAQVAPAPPSDNSNVGGGIRIPTAPVETGPIRTILLFPFANAIPAADTSGGFSPDIVGARVEDAVKLKLNVIGRFKANSFSPALPQIQRALQEARVEGLSENDLVPPYDDAQKGQKIAAQVGTDGYLLGTIESLRIDPATRNVTLTVAATLRNSVTGRAAKVVGVTGHGISYNATDDPDSLLQEAINDVAGHIVSALDAGASHTEQLTPVRKQSERRRGGGGFLVGLLLLSAIGIAIGASHHGGGGGNNGGGINPPPSTGTCPPPPPAHGIIGTTSGPPSPPVVH